MNTSHTIDVLLPEHVFGGTVPTSLAGRARVCLEMQRFRAAAQTGGPDRRYIMHRDVARRAVSLLSAPGTLSVNLDSGIRNHVTLTVNLAAAMQVGKEGPVLELVYAGIQLRQWVIVNKGQIISVRY